MGKRSRRCGPVSRVAERRVGEGEGKGGRTLRAVPRTFPAYGRAPASLWAKCRSQRQKCTRQSLPLPVRSPRAGLSTAEPLPLVCRITVRNGGSTQGNPCPCPCVLPAPACLRPCTLPADGRTAVRSSRVSPPKTEPLPPTAESLCAKAEVHKAIPAPARAFSPRQLVYGRALCPLMGESQCAMGEGEGKGGRPLAQQPALSPPTAPPPPPKWVPRLRRREGKRPNGAPPHHNAHTPNAARKRYLHNSRTKTRRRTKRCAQFVIFVFTPCKLLHNFSTVLHRSPRSVRKRAQIVARRPDFPCFTARFPNVLPESHRAKHPRTAPVLPPKNASLRAYAKPRPHSRVRGTRQHATTCAFFTFSARYERVGGTRNANFCPAEGRKWGRFRSQMLKNGPQTKKSTFSFGRLVI